MSEEQQNTEHQCGGLCKCKQGKCKLKTWHIFVLAIVGFILVAFLVFYGFMANAVKNVSQSPFVLKTAKALHLPAAEVNGSKVLYSDYIDDLNTLKKFYSAKPAGFPDATPEQMSDQVLSRLVANNLIKEEAEKYKVKITDADVNTFKAQLLKQFPDEKTAETELMSKYGWSMATYVEKVIKPIVLEQNLQNAFNSSTSADAVAYKTPQVRASHILFMVNQGDNDATIKAKAQKVLSEIKAGADFATLAKQYGSDSTKDAGGDLGWFGKGQMVPEFEAAAFSIPVGTVGEQLVKTQYGYHIIKVTDKKDSPDFIAFMDNLLRKAKVELNINVHNPFTVLQNPTATSTTK